MRRRASRARRRVRGAEPKGPADIHERQEMVAAFLAAARDGDLDRLLSILDPDVVFRLDAGPTSPLARPPVHGAKAVAEEIVARGTPFVPLAQPAMVNGVPGALVRRDRRVIAIANIVVSDGLISQINIVFDHAKLRHIVVG
jgi:RNA polymerase sigma-70 factor (ECF subfamily)